MPKCSISMLVQGSHTASFSFPMLFSLAPIVNGLMAHRTHVRTFIAIHTDLYWIEWRKSNMGLWPVSIQFEKCLNAISLWLIFFSNRSHSLLWYACIDGGGIWPGVWIWIIELVVKSIFGIQLWNKCVPTREWKERKKTITLMAA